MDYVNENMNKEFSLCNYIAEAPIIQRAEVVKSYPKLDKCVFRAILQDFGNPNRNRRIYNKDDVIESIEMLRPEMLDRNWYGEMDHPDDGTSMDRKGIVKLSDASHMILDWQADGNDLIGELETTSTAKGKDLYGLVAVDKAKLGFSCRSFGQVRPDGQIMIVTKPMKVITYDAVSYPSHQRAKVQNLISEGKIRPISLNEAYQAIEVAKSCNSNVVLYEGTKYVIEYFEMLIEHYTNIRNRKLYSFLG